MTDERPYSPGLEGVVAAETALGYVDGERGRLLYRGYRIGDLVERGTYPAVANLLWTGDWAPDHHLATGPLPDAVLATLRALPRDVAPMDALRTAVSAWGATQELKWPPTPEQARALTSFSPTALAAFARIRKGLDPIEPDPSLDLVPGFLYQLNGERPEAATARALDAYFMVGAEHGLNASTFTARVITSTQSDMASAVAGAIGALKGPLHGGAPTHVVEQIHTVGSPERAEQWVRDTLAKGERLMGFGHRVYRAYDPRAVALRKVAESMEHPPEWLALAIAVEDVALRVLAEKHPERPLKTNVEFYAAPVLMGVGLTPDLFPATFALARHAGWTAHII
jgi:citrate synthase